MGMRDYAVDDYGVVLDDEAFKYAAQVLNQTNELFEDDYCDTRDEVAEALNLDMIGNFCGEAFRVKGNGNCDYSDALTYDDDCVYFYGLRHPTLFKAAYKSVDEIAAECRAAIGKYLPQTFDYVKHIRHIVGTYYG